MGVTYEDAVKAQQELEEKILRDPNVVSIGVIAETNELGEKTGDYVVKVGIISTEDYQSSLAHGDSLIPQKYKLLDRKNTQDEKYVRIQVVKTGRIKALSSYHSDSEKNDFPSAIDRIPSTSSHAPNDHTSKRRPSLGGYSIGHPNITAGTLGLVLEYTEGPHAGKAFILSNNHVMAANNLAYVGDAIIQKRFYSNSASLFSNRTFLISRNLLIPPTKYGAIITVATSMGLYAATIKLASVQASYQLAKNVVEPSSFALTSCKFFRDALSEKTKGYFIGALKL